MTNLNQTNETQKHPDTQKEPLGIKQKAWIDEIYGKAFFRDPSEGPMVKPRAMQ